MWVKFTTPSPGRDRDSRLPVHSVSAYRVSPANSGAGKATSENPRLATRVPWVSCDTDSPTMVERVNIELISRCPPKPGCCADHAASRCRACVFMVSVVKSTLSASVTVRPGRCS